jgi:hypothetical protein
MRPRSRKKDTIALERYKTQTNIQFGTTETKARIRKSNANIEANAMRRLRAGDHEGAIARMKDLNVEADVKEEMIRRMLNEGLYQEVNQILQTFEQLPTGEAIEATEELVKGLEEKIPVTFENTEGEEVTENIYNEFEFLDPETGRPLGGLNYRSRADLIVRARNQIKALKRFQVRQANELVRRAARGELGIVELEEAIDRGDVPEEMAKLLQRSIQQETKYQVDNAEQVQDIQDQMADMAGEGWFNRQEMSDKKYKELMGLIDGAEVTFDTKIQLFEQFLELKNHDFSNSHEQAGQFWGRDMSAREIQIREDLEGIYRQLLPEVGAREMGYLFFNQEKKIRDFFDAGERSLEEVEQFKKELEAEAYTQEVNRIMQTDAFDFGM